jgi:signal transduction histidine kinase
MSGAAGNPEGDEDVGRTPRAGDRPEDDVDVHVRIERLVLALERLAGGDLDERVPISPRHDAIDAIAHGANALAGEFQYVSTRLRRLLSAAETASQSKSALLRNVAGQIRALARAQSPDPLLVARSLLALADDLVDVSQIESGTFDYDLQPFALPEAVAEVLRGLEAEAHRKGLELSLEVAPPLPPFVVVDARRLRQILTTLVRNAVQFTERGGVVVRLHAVGETRVAVEVIDTGIGIAESRADTLFVPFRQVEPASGGKLGASGLGLPLAKRLAQGMGGDVRLIESAPGKGTSFCVLLSVTPATS